MSHQSNSTTPIEQRFTSRKLLKHLHAAKKYPLTAFDQYQNDFYSIIDSIKAVPALKRPNTLLPNPAITLAWWHPTQFNESLTPITAAMTSFKQFLVEVPKLSPSTRSNFIKSETPRLFFTALQSVLKRLIFNQINQDGWVPPAITTSKQRTGRSSTPQQPSISPSTTNNISQELPMTVQDFLPFHNVLVFQNDFWSTLVTMGNITVEDVPSPMYEFSADFHRIDRIYITNPQRQLSQPDNSTWTGLLDQIASLHKEKSVTRAIGSDNPPVRDQSHLSCHLTEYSIYMLLWDALYTCIGFNPNSNPATELTRYRSEVAMYKVFRDRLVKTTQLFLYPSILHAYKSLLRFIHQKTPTNQRQFLTLTTMIDNLQSLPIPSFPFPEYQSQGDKSEQQPSQLPPKKETKSSQTDFIYSKRTLPLTTLTTLYSYTTHLPPIHSSHHSPTINPLATSNITIPKSPQQEWLAGTNIPNDGSVYRTRNWTYEVFCAEYCRWLPVLYPQVLEIQLQLLGYTFSPGFPRIIPDVDFDGLSYLDYSPQQVVERSAFLDKRWTFFSQIIKDKWPFQGLSYDLFHESFIRALIDKPSELEPFVTDDKLKQMRLDEFSLKFFEKIQIESYMFFAAWSKRSDLNAPLISHRFQSAEQQSTLSPMTVETVGKEMYSVTLSPEIQQPDQELDQQPDQQPGQEPDQNPDQQPNQQLLLDEAQSKFQVKSFAEMFASLEDCPRAQNDGYFFGAIDPQTRTAISETNTAPVSSVQQELGPIAQFQSKFAVSWPQYYSTLFFKPQIDDFYLLLTGHSTTIQDESQTEDPKGLQVDLIYPSLLWHNHTFDSIPQQTVLYSQDAGRREWTVVFPQQSTNRQYDSFVLAVLSRASPKVLHIMFNTMPNAAEYFNQAVYSITMKYMGIELEKCELKLEQLFEIAGYFYGKNLVVAENDHITNVGILAAGSGAETINDIMQRIKDLSV